ncbi:MAG: flotillin-like FloA family protein [Planctomycetes bacterium]|nr:flotillin-like FloA family protein [Planctomycetota bacterium]
MTAAIRAALHPLVVAGIVVVGVLLVAGYAVFRWLRPWLAARVGGVPMGLGEYVGMRRRGIDARAVTYALLRAHQAGVQVTREQLEAHDKAGGHVGRTVAALIGAEQADLRLTWRMLAAVDLAGRDPLVHVRAARRSRQADGEAGTISDAYSSGVFRDLRRQSGKSGP